MGYDGRLFAAQPVEGTYLVFRKYLTHVDRFPSSGEMLQYHDTRVGGTVSRTAAQIVGRCPVSGAVVHARSGELLPSLPDESQVVESFLSSHIHKANPRGSGLSRFGDEVVVPDVRILRRSYPYCDGEQEGLLFLCFQADIQQWGFEYIHNEWLMSEFNGGHDPLLNPDTGLVEVETGCYYFAPREQARLSTVLRPLVAGKG